MTRFDRITPDGTKDYIFDEIKIKRWAEDKLCGLFEAEGYRQIMTPTLEFFDVFTKGGTIKQNDLFTLTDSAGNLLALRPDSTKPIARLYASRLRGESLPLKLFYNQTVFRRRNQGFNGKFDEIMQTGTELLGGDEQTIDPRFVALAIRSMKGLFKDNFLLEIGHVDLINPLLDELESGLKEDLKQSLAAKNIPQIQKISGLLGDKGQALKQLPNLFGGREVLAQAEQLLKNQQSKNAIKQLSALFDYLDMQGLAKYVIIDPTLINMYDYYTGIMFKGYVKGVGCEIISGGRYDTLYKDYDIDMPAIGFAINISETVEILKGGSL